MEAQVGGTAPCEFNRLKHTIRYNATPLSCKGYGGGVERGEKEDRHLQCHKTLVPIRQASYPSLGVRRRDERNQYKNAQMLESTQRGFEMFIPGKEARCWERPCNSSFIESGLSTEAHQYLILHTIDIQSRGER